MNAATRPKFPVVRISCPICSRIIEDAPDDFGPRPFCSMRCKLVDLDNWLNEAYRLSRPLTVEELDEVEPPENAPRRDR